MSNCKHGLNVYGGNNHENHLGENTQDFPQSEGRTTERQYRLCTVDMRELNAKKDGLHQSWICCSLVC